MFGRKKLGGGGGGASSFSAKIAHTTIMPSLIGNKDLKLLQDFITAEKNVVLGLQKLATDYSKAAETLKLWGQGEGDDLADVLAHSAGMFMHFTDALNQYAIHEQSIRVLLKRIRTEEEDLDKIKKERRSVGSKADSAEKKLQKMTPENKNLPEQTDLLTRLREEMRMLDVQIINGESRLGDFKRQTSKEILLLKFGGLGDCGEKAKVVGYYGNMLAQHVPLETTQPGSARAYYNDYDATSKLASETSRAISEVHFESPVVMPGGPAPPGAPSAGVSEPNTPLGQQGPHPALASTISGYPASSSGPTDSVDEFGNASGPPGPQHYNTYQPTSYQTPPLVMASPLAATSPYAPPPVPPPHMMPQRAASSDTQNSRFAAFPAPRSSLTHDESSQDATPTPYVPPPNAYNNAPSGFVAPPPPPPPPDHNVHEAEPSFSESIADALAADSYLRSLSHDDDAHSSDPRRLSEPPASVAATYGSDPYQDSKPEHPPWSPGAALPMSVERSDSRPYPPTAGSHLRQPVDAEDDVDTNLAYATDPTAPSPTQSKLRRSLDNEANYDGSTHWLRKNTDIGDMPRSPRASDEHNHYPSALASHPHTHPHGAVHFQNEDDTNAAATREVNREMDALAFHSAPRPNSPPVQQQQQQQQSYLPPSGPPPPGPGHSPAPPLQNVLHTTSTPASPERSTFIPPVPTPGSPMRTPASPRVDYVPSAPSPRIPSNSISAGVGAGSPSFTPPKLNLSGLGPGGGPPSPGNTTPGKISASAFRRPFGKKSTLGLAAEAGTLAGPPYNAIPPGEPPMSHDDSAALTPNAYGQQPYRSVSNSSLTPSTTSMTGGVSPLNLRAKPRTGPLPPVPQGAAGASTGSLPLPPGAQPPRPPMGQHMTDQFYTPSEGKGAGGSDYGFAPSSFTPAATGGGGPRESIQSYASVDSVAPPYSFITPSADGHIEPESAGGHGHGRVGDIPDEEEYMRALERGDHPDSDLR